MKYDESQVLDILRSVRHDMLNDLQLLKANVALNRVDRIELILEKIVNKARNEAKLSNLHAPKLAMLLLGYNWESRPFQLEVEVTGEDGDWRTLDDHLHDLMLDILDAFGNVSDKLSDNMMTVSIHADEENLDLSICYSGKIINHDFLEQYFNELNQTYHFVEKYIQEEEAVITFQLADHLR